MSNGDISNYLALIESAVYGEDVRGAIHDAIEACYTDTSTSATLADAAASEANSAAALANTAAGAANTAASAAQTASSFVPNVIAPAFVEATEYPSGYYVTNSGKMYKLTADHAANVTWENTSKEEATAGEVIAFLEKTTDIYKQVLDVSTVGKVTGLRFANWKNGIRIGTPATGSTASLAEVVNPDMMGCVMDISPGEILYWNGRGGTGNGTKAWAFINSSNVVIERSENDLAAPQFITAPENSAKVILNNYTSYNGVPITGQYAFVGHPINRFKVLNHRMRQYVSNWQSGYYTASGEYYAFTRTICTKTPIVVPHNCKMSLIAPPTWKIVVYEYDENGTYLRSIGGITSASTTEDSLSMIFDAPKGYRYHIAIGTAPTGTSMSSYLTQDFIDSLQVYTNIYDERHDPDCYVLSTGDTTDRTDEINAVLEARGVCELGPGVFYTTGIEMPDNTSLIGSGAATQVILDSRITTGAAISMGSKCNVSNMSVVGSLTDISFDTSGDIDTLHIGNRHGILWLGEAVYGDSAANQHFYGSIDSVRVYGFTGGGITCDGSGYNTSGGINASNCIAYNCGAGINVAYWSEYCRFTNINCTRNYYGCVNNGGNNLFNACNFSANHVGFYINGADGKGVRYDGTAVNLPNNGHGTASGCTINHSGLGSNDNGYAVYCKSAGAGFTFDGCQIHYGKVYSRGVSYLMFTNTNFGSAIEITIWTPGTYIFMMCYFHGDLKVYPYDASTGERWATFNSDGNLTRFKFLNCYDASGGLVTVRSASDATP